MNNEINHLYKTNHLNHLNHTNDNNNFIIINNHSYNSDKNIELSFGHNKSIVDISNNLLNKSSQQNTLGKTELNNLINELSDKFITNISDKVVAELSDKLINRISNKPLIEQHIEPLIEPLIASDIISDDLSSIETSNNPTYDCLDKKSDLISSDNKFIIEKDDYNQETNCQHNLKNISRPDISIRISNSINETETNNRVLSPKDYVINGFKRIFNPNDMSLETYLDMEEIHIHDDSDDEKDEYINILRKKNKLELTTSENMFDKLKSNIEELETVLLREEKEWAFFFSGKTLI